MEQDRGERRGNWITGLLPALAAGMGLRLWYYLDLAGQPFFNYPIVDSLTYDRMALAILSGEGGSVFARPPLYPYFLSVLYALGGHHQGVVAWAQFLLGLAAVVPVYLLAERWFGRRAAALTACLYSLPTDKIKASVRDFQGLEHRENLSSLAGISDLAVRDDLGCSLNPI